MRDVITCEYCGGDAASTDGGETYRCDCGCFIIDGAYFINGHWTTTDDFKENT